jgi:hypothetical protein
VLGVIGDGATEVFDETRSRELELEADAEVDVVPTEDDIPTLALSQVILTD